MRIEEVRGAAARARATSCCGTQVALTCGTDVKVFRRGYHARMIVPPAVFGHEVAGVVEEVGAGRRGSSSRACAVVVAPTPPPAATATTAGTRCREPVRRPPLLERRLRASSRASPRAIVAKNLLALAEGLSFRRGGDGGAAGLRGARRRGERDRPRASRWPSSAPGPIGLMFVALARMRGAHVTAAGRRAVPPGQGAGDGGGGRGGGAGRRRTSRSCCASAAPTGRGFDVVIEAVGQPGDLGGGGARRCARGASCNLFGGCPTDTHIGIDSQRLHYQELTIKSTFHHTPGERAQGLPADRGWPHRPERVHHRATRRSTTCPTVLGHMARGGDGLKTAILP